MHGSATAYVLQLQNTRDRAGHEDGTGAWEMRVFVDSITVEPGTRSMGSVTHAVRAKVSMETVRSSGSGIWTSGETMGVDSKGAVLSVP